MEAAFYAFLEYLLIGVIGAAGIAIAAWLWNHGDDSKDL